MRAAAHHPAFSHDVNRSPEALGVLTFPEGEAALHPRRNTPDKRHFAATVQWHRLSLLHPHIIYISAVAAVVLQDGLQSGGGVCRSLQFDDAVQTAHTRVRHLNKSHLGEMVATPVHTAACDIHNM